VNSQDAEEEKERQRLQNERENAAVVATQVGALANVGLAGTKGIIGYGVNSTALMADAGTKLETGMKKA
jgi:divalent metal cation (Fe/Co/Zn/Cd) transporter